MFHFSFAVWLAGWLYACVQVRKTSTTFIFLYCLFSFVSSTYFVVTCAVCIVWMSHRERELETRWKKCLAHVSVLRWIKEKLQIQTIKLQGYADVIVVVLLATALKRHRMQVAKTCTSHQWHTNLPLNVNFVLELTRKTKEPTIYPWRRFLIYPYKKIHLRLIKSVSSYFGIYLYDFLAIWEPTLSKKFLRSINETRVKITQSFCMSDKFVKEEKVQKEKKIVQLHSMSTRVPRYLVPVRDIGDTAPRTSHSFAEIHYVCRNKRKHLTNRMKNGKQIKFYNTFCLWWEWGCERERIIVNVGPLTNAVAFEWLIKL